MSGSLSLSLSDLIFLSSNPVIELQTNILIEKSTKHLKQIWFRAINRIQHVILR
jgi:hypothetical protein